MGKKKTVRTRGNSAPLPTMEDEFEVSEPIQDCCDAYSKALTAANRAKGKLNTAKDNAIAMMREEGIERVRVQTDKGEKFLTLTNEDKLRLVKVKTPDGEED